jgi:hypothetical protein
MPSSLTKTIETHINKKVNSYILQVSEKFNLNKDELNCMWNDLNGIKVKKVSNFQKFCRTQRQQLKDGNPDMTFGDMNKQLGSMWQKLTDEEKNSFN